MLPTVRAACAALSVPRTCSVTLPVSSACPPRPATTGTRRAAPTVLLARLASSVTSAPNAVSHHVTLRTIHAARAAPPVPQVRSVTWLDRSVAPRCPATTPTRRVAHAVRSVRRGRSVTSRVSAAARPATPRTGRAAPGVPCAPPSSSVTLRSSGAWYPRHARTRTLRKRPRMRARRVCEKDLASEPADRMGDRSGRLWRGRGSRSKLAWCVRHDR